MRVSELIKHLKYIEDTHGDIPVLLFDEDNGVGDIGEFTTEQNTEGEYGFIIDIDKEICTRCGYRVKKTNYNGLCRGCEIDIERMCSV